MENEIMTVEEKKPLTAMAVVARVRLIQEVMANVMKKDVHYGTIPGTPKPTLYKPGAEQLLVTFRIAPTEPKVEDLSTDDCIRYRVTRTGVSNGTPIASGVGECSSDEEKYKWRSPVCDAEYEAMVPDRRRLKWKRDGSSYKQVRTNPADMANTILKMADKRAFIAMTLLATAASDCFAQDLEDLPEEVRDSITESERPKHEPIKPAERKSEPTDGEVAEFVPADFNTKTGEGKKGPWTKFGVKSPDGQWYGTFNEADGELIGQAMEAKKAIRIVWKQDGNYRTIVKAVVL